MATGLFPEKEFAANCLIFITICNFLLMKIERQEVDNIIYIMLSTYVILLPTYEYTVTYLFYSYPF